MQPREQRLTTLGMLQHLGDPRVPLLAHTRLRRIQFLVTQRWGLIQGGWLPEAEALWAECIELLELDADAVQDLMLLVAQGIAGRSEANEILWDLLTPAG